MDILTLFAVCILLCTAISVLVIFSISYSVYRDMNNGGYRATFNQFAKLYNGISGHDCVKYDTDSCFWHESIMYTVTGGNTYRRNIIYLHASIVQIGDIKLIFGPIDFVRFCLWKKKEIKRLNTLKIMGEI